MNRKLKIKVCGMREAANIRQVAALGIDYMGFIFFSGSPRYVDQMPFVELPEKIRKTGVFVNTPADSIERAGRELGLDVIQLHGDETRSDCLRLKKAGFEILKAIPVLQAEDFERTDHYQNAVDLFLFDTKSVVRGGSGKRFDWALLDRYTGDVPFLLSGGIRPGMAGEIRQLEHPAMAGLDLNSGFEESPAVKSISSLKTFVNEIRS